MWRWDGLWHRQKEGLLKSTSIFQTACRERGWKGRWVVCRERGREGDMSGGNGEKGRVRTSSDGLGRVTADALIFSRWDTVSGCSTRTYLRLRHTCVMQRRSFSELSAWAPRVKRAQTCLHATQPASKTLPLKYGWTSRVWFKAAVAVYTVDNSFHLRHGASISWFFCLCVF